MSETVAKKMSAYQLRYAAGQYWLLDMEQEGNPYKHPKNLNCVGAEIWKRMESGQQMEQIAQELAREYEVEVEEVRKDIADFCKQLNTYGVIAKE